MVAWKKSRWLLWLAAGVAAIALAWSFDSAVGVALDASNNVWLSGLAAGFSRAGEGWVVALGGIVLAAMCFGANRPRLAADIFFVSLVADCTGLIATILRSLSGRPRPLTHLPDGFYGVWHDGHWIIGKFAFSAFPSGHAATAVGLAAAVWLAHRGWGVIATLYALAVMWSRVALRYHHLSDVVASAVLSIPIACLLKQLLAPVVESQCDRLYRLWRKR